MDLALGRYLGCNTEAFSTTDPSSVKAYAFSQDLFVTLCSKSLVLRLVDHPCCSCEPSISLFGIILHLTPHIPIPISPSFLHLYRHQIDSFSIEPRACSIFHSQFYLEQLARTQDMLRLVFFLIHSSQIIRIAIMRLYRLITTCWHHCFLIFIAHHSYTRLSIINALVSDRQFNSHITCDLSNTWSN